MTPNRLLLLLGSMALASLLAGLTLTLFDHAVISAVFIAAGCGLAAIASAAFAFTGPGDPGRALVIMGVGLVVMIFAFALAHRTLGLWNTRTLRETTSFGAALYYSVITCTSVGYGDVQPLPGAGRAIAALQALIGYAYLGVFIGLFIQLRRWLDAESRKESVDSSLLERIRQDVLLDERMTRFKDSL